MNADYERLGHASVTLDDIRHFRQLDSKAPGHPEYHWVSGVETTTGPLGQGVATSVGMAIAQKWLADRYNRPGFEIFDYDIYAVCGDGCLMEGVASEAASLAGHLGPRQPLLGLRQQPHHDRRAAPTSPSPRMSRPGSSRTAGTCCAWATPTTSIASSTRLDVFRKTKGRPTFIVLDSHIGYGSPHKQDTAAAHGEPLGDDEVRLAKRSYGWPEDAQFLVPDGVREHFAAGIGARGAAAPEQLDGTLRGLSRQVSPSSRPRSSRCSGASCRPGGTANLPVFPADAKGIAGRDASGKVLNVLAQNIPWFLGGSADLGPSNKTHADYEGAGDFQADTPGGKNLHFGIREHAMAAIVNGLSLSKLRAFGATFFIFSDYARPAIRLSALMELPALFVFTHDAMGDGEDGPTHQPVEQLASLRAIPGLVIAAARRRQRGRRGLSLHHAAAPPAGGAGAVAPAPADPGSAASTRRPPASPAAPTCSPTPRRQARGDPHRSGSEVILAVAGPREATSPRASARAWSRCRPGTSSSTRRRSTGRACCRRQ